MLLEGSNAFTTRDARDMELAALPADPLEMVMGVPLESAMPVEVAGVFKARRMSCRLAGKVIDCSTAVIVVHARETMTAVSSVASFGSGGGAVSAERPSRLDGGGSTRTVPSMVCCVAVLNAPEKARRPTGPSGLAN